MGVSNSSNIDKQNKVLISQLNYLGIQNAQQYRFVEKRNQDCIILQNINNKGHYILRVITFSMFQDSSQLMKIIQKRIKINSIHLCKILTAKNQHQTIACSEIYKLYLLIQCPLNSIRVQFERRKQKVQKLFIKSYFQQSELWGIIYSVIKALKSLYLYGIVHQSLSLQSIYISQKGFIKLADPVTFDLQKNYIRAMKQKQNCKKILSPQILIFLEEYNFYFYQKEKSDIFVLGILLLQLSTLNEFIIYDYKQKKTNFQAIDIELNKIKTRYSSKFCRCLQWMVQIQPKKRPNLSQILQFIDKNNSDASTQLTNSIYPTPTQVPTVIAKKHLRDNSVSAFSIDQKYHYQNPASFTPLSFNKYPIHETNPFNYSPNLLPTQKQPQIKKQEPSSKLQSNPSKKMRKQSEQSKEVFPFQLVYHRVINNNDNMKKFQITNLCQQYKNSDIFNSSCRGSIPTESYHARIENLGRENPNIESRKIYSNINEDLGNSNKRQYQKNVNLVYSNSNYENQPSRFTSSKNSLSQFKLVQSSHIKQNQPTQIQKNHPPPLQQLRILPYQSTIPITTKNHSDKIQQLSQQSPYRKLHSFKSYEVKSVYEMRFQDIQPIVFHQKNNQQLQHSSLLKRFNTENKNMNENKQNKQFNIAELTDKFFSQEKEKSYNVAYNNNNGNNHYVHKHNSRLNENFISSHEGGLQTYKSQKLTHQQHLEFLKAHQNKQKPSSAQIKQITFQCNSNRYQVLEDSIKEKQYLKINDNRSVKLTFSNQIVGSKNIQFLSSEIESKISRITPNFNQKDKITNNEKFMGSNQIRNLEKLNLEKELATNDLIFVQNAFNEQGDKYTGYKNKLGLKQRHGKLQFYDGGYYQGQWKNDKMQGYGQMYYSNGTLAYKGLWKEGCFNGNGILYNDCTQNFDYQFNYNNFAQIQNKWICYQGEFQMDSKHGKGKIKLSNGQYFEGNFDYDMIQGYGVFCTKSGHLIKGIWKDNQFSKEL